MARIFRDLFVPLFVTPSDFICILQMYMLIHLYIITASTHNCLCGKYSSDWLLYYSQPWGWAPAVYHRRMSTGSQCDWLHVKQWQRKDTVMMCTWTITHSSQFTCSDPLLAHLMMHGWIKDHISGLGHPGNITLYRTSLLMEKRQTSYWNASFSVS